MGKINDKLDSERTSFGMKQIFYYWKVFDILFKTNEIKSRWYYVFEKNTDDLSVTILTNSFYSFMEPESLQVLFRMPFLPGKDICAA